MQSNIAIVGAVKARNYDVAKALSEQLDMLVLDCDGYIEYEFGLDINKIIADFGKEYFYKLEAKKLSRLEGYDNALLSLSPTCLIDIANIMNIREYSYIVTLVESYDDAYDSAAEDKTLVLREDVLSQFNTVHNNLMFAAQNLSNVVVDITGLRIEDIATIIFDKLGEIFNAI